MVLFIKIIQYLFRSIPFQDQKRSIMLGYFPGINNMTNIFYSIENDNFLQLNCLEYKFITHSGNSTFNRGLNRNCL